MVEDTRRWARTTSIGAVADAPGDQENRRSEVVTRLSRRHFLGAFAATGTVALLTACSGTSAPSAAPTSAAAPAGAATAPAATAAPASAAAPANGAASTLNILTWAPANDVGRNTDQKFLEAYVAANHLNVTVATQDVPFGTYMQKLQTMFAANVAPDVLWMSIWRTGPFIEANKVMALDDFIKGVQLPAYRPVALNDGKFGGKQYGLPTAASTWVLYFNATLFQEAGLKTPLELEAANNWNWDQAVAAAEKITKTSGGRTSQFGWMTDTQFYTWCTYAYANGGEFLNQDHTQFLVASQQTTDALQWLGDMIVSRKVSPSVSDQQQEGYVPRFASGKLGMMNDWAGDGINIKKAMQTQFDWDIIAAPWTSKQVGYWHANLIEINTATKIKDSAWAICQQLASTAIEEARLKAGIPNTPVINDETLINLYTTSMPMKNAKVIIDLLDKAIPLPYNDNWEEQRFKVVEPFMQEVFNGQVKAADKIQQIQTTLDGMLPKNNYL
jgi:multiple sugar transport system substrate-binding protein